jgi:recombination protein RecA
MKVSTGSVALDVIMGGGIHNGITQIFGESSSGVTTLSLSVLAEAERSGLRTAFVNAQYSTDQHYVARFAPNSIFVIPTSGESVFENINVLLLNGVKVVVLDTLDATVPLAEQGEMAGDRVPYAQRRLIAHSLVSLLKNYDDFALIINTQVRQDIRSNGRKLKPSIPLVGYANSILELKRLSFKSKFGSLLWRSSNATVKYSSFVAPGASTELTFWSIRGLDRRYELFKSLKAVGILERSGNRWVTEDGEVFGPGLKLALKQLGELYNEFQEGITG